jgi:hypothetical protein
LRARLASCCLKKEFPYRHFSSRGDKTGSKVAALIVSSPTAGMQNLRTEFFVLTRRKEAARSLSLAKAVKVFF